jgi:hypothetical protein
VKALFLEDKAPLQITRDEDSYKINRINKENNQPMWDIYLNEDPSTFDQVYALRELLNTCLEINNDKKWAELKLYIESESSEETPHNINLEELTILHALINNSILTPPPLQEGQ